jgi:hypothetical protein
MSDQQLLSEQLQLFHELTSASDLEVRDAYEPRATTYGQPTIQDIVTRFPEARAELRLLDTIAASLTTGEEDDVVAVALEKHQSLCLVLAKNGSPTPEDKRAAVDFISTITNPKLETSTDVFPFLMSRCRKSIDKRINQLHESISTLIASDLDIVLSKYTSGTIKEELPRSKFYRKKKYKDQEEPPILTIIKDLIHSCSKWSSYQLIPDDVEKSKSQFALLTIVSDTLLRSRFLKQLVGDLTLGNVDGKLLAEKLRRRLGKICIYLDGMENLIVNVKRWFPNGQIPHRWVEDTFIGTGEGKLTLCDEPTKALWRQYGSGHPLSQETLAVLDERFPSLTGNWQQRKSVQTCLHAELRIILHLTPPPTPGDDSSTFDLTLKPIGCSKRSCLCCALWILALRSMFLATPSRWITSGCSSKSYANWALPGAAFPCAEAFDRDGRSRVDADVLHAVEIRLEDKMSRLFPGERWTAKEQNHDEDYGESCQNQ